MYLKVGRERGEDVRRILAEKEIIDLSRRILQEGDYLLIPVKGEVDIPGTELVEGMGEVIPRRPLSLVDALSGELDGGELMLVPKSFDVVGDIAIIEVPEDLGDRREVIGDALLKTFRNIKVVVNKTSSVGGRFRTRRLRVIAGESRNETVHREFGCLYKLDVELSYFSPRLGTERMRVASQVRGGERVLVMFAGVGPYPVLIAKLGSPGEGVAVELNPEAVRYLRENIVLNKVEVDVVCGDVGVEVPRLGGFDRIVMPLPKDAGDFLDVALPALNKGGVIHFYCFSSGTGEAVEGVEAACRSLGYEVEVLDAVKCGSYSPGVYRICVDFRVI
ncbi:MAG: class I SAM-dependent methyltransferase family protein [Candidatus Altiarchaeales archaeon]|nr:class I SAM-dependent methyltransferase family protein [Candidatus Altiarchaeales archaeon]